MSRKWKVTASTPTEPEAPKYILEFSDVQAISGDYYEVTEEWFETFYQKLRAKQIELEETFSIEKVVNPDENENVGTFIAILCASKEELTLGWLITRNEPEETGILVGICPEEYVNMVRESVDNLHLLVEFVKRPRMFKNISVGISLTLE
ncbi:MAG: hypothetical protein ACE5R6_09310 [Candidatus Heimdallarchaeota archaeon]